MHSPLEIHPFGPTCLANSPQGVYWRSENLILPELQRTLKGVVCAEIGVRLAARRHQASSAGKVVEKGSCIVRNEREVMLLWGFGGLESWVEGFSAMAQ